jgi:predicted AlkP superfamily pyrophosphatase or phosphodiesterase
MVISIFVDGLKFETFGRDMPFLSSLNVLPLKPEFGYSCCCHATMYTGLSPKEHNTWCVWKRGNESPYRWINKIPFLKYFNWIPLKIILGKVTRLFVKNNSFPGIPILVNLPLKYWGEFVPCEKDFWTDEEYLKKTPTIFKILKKNNINHEIVGLNHHPNYFNSIKNIQIQDKEFYYFFCGEVDGISHSKGEDSIELRDYLKKLDDSIKEIFEKAKKIDNDVTLFAFSDHGHIMIKNRICLQDYFKKEKLNMDHYLGMCESTLARFWLRKQNDEEEILKVLQILEKDGFGKIMDRETAKEYFLDFDSNEHGDIIFYLNGGNIFSKTIWGFGHRIVSAHGYFPQISSHYGVFVSNKKINTEIEYASLKDILPTELSLLNIQNNGLEGKVLINNDK